MTRTIDPWCQTRASARDGEHRCALQSGGMDSVTDSRYALSVTEARDLTTDTLLEPTDLAWLLARLDEYRDLLEYLREH